MPLKTDHIHDGTPSRGRKILPNDLDVDVTKVTTEVVLVKTNNYIRGDASTASFVVRLPAATIGEGTIFNVKKIDSTNNTVDLLPNGGIIGGAVVGTHKIQTNDTIDGATILQIIFQYDSVTMTSDGLTLWDVT